MDGLQKPEVSLRCLRSLARSIAEVPDHRDCIQLRIIDDASGPEFVAEWTAALDKAGVSAEWLHVDSRSGATSFQAALELALASAANHVYFVEDDYLHYPEAMEMSVAALAGLGHLTPGHEVALTTYDCPDRYVRDRYPTTIVHLGDRYWRTVRHTTGTFLVARTTLRRFNDKYREFGFYGKKNGVCEDNTINHVYSEVPCFAPIPTLSIHLQYEETLPLLLPAGGWRDLWNEMAS